MQPFSAHFGPRSIKIRPNMKRVYMTHMKKEKSIVCEARCTAQRRVMPQGHVYVCMTIMGTFAMAES